MSADQAHPQLRVAVINLDSELGVIIADWLAQGTRRGTTLDGAGDLTFLRRADNAATVAAVWAGSAPCPLGVPDGAGGVDCREGTLADLRAALGLSSRCRGGERWEVLPRTSPSGKRLFRCSCCGRESTCPDKRCPSQGEVRDEH